MKLVAVIASLVTLVVLVLDFTNGTLSESNTEKNTTEPQVVLPKVIDKQLLPIEDKWQKMQSEKENVNKDKTKPKDQNNDFKLLLGDKNYKLLGIFKEQEKDFVLLKDEKNQIIKLGLNDSLPGGFSLVDIESDIIAFVMNNERVEFKLFEYKSHAKN